MTMAPIPTRTASTPLGMPVFLAAGGRGTYGVLSGAGRISDGTGASPPAPLLPATGGTGGGTPGPPNIDIGSRGALLAPAAAPAKLVGVGAATAMDRGVWPLVVGEARIVVVGPERVVAEVGLIVHEPAPE